MGGSFGAALFYGHGDSLVKRIYGHLGTVRHRSEVVEYRWENHQDQIEDQLRTIGIGV